MMTKSMYHIPNLAIRNANFRLQTHNNLSRLYPLSNRSFERLKSHRRVSYLWVLISLLWLLILLSVLLS